MASYLKEEYSALKRLVKTQTGKTNQSQEMIGWGCWKDRRGQSLAVFLNSSDSINDYFLLGVTRDPSVFGNQLN